MRFPIGNILRAIVPVLPALVNRIIPGKRTPAGVPQAPQIQIGTQPNRPGTATSEYANTRAVQLVAAVVAIVALFWPGAPVDALRETLLWIAALIGGGAQVAYVAARSSVKGSLARAAASQYVATVAQQMQQNGAPARDTLAAVRGAVASSGADPNVVPLTRQQRRAQERTERKS